MNMKKKRIISLILIFLLVLGLTAQGILLLATPVDPQIAPQAFLGVNLILLAVAAGVALPVFKEGLPGLVGKPSPHTLPAVAAVAAALQLVVCLLLPNGYDPDKTTVFAPLAVLLLFADLLGSRLMYRVVETNFGLVSSGVDHAAAYCLKDKQLAGTLTAGMEEKDPTLLLSRPAALVKDFVAQSFSARRSDATAQKIASYFGVTVGYLLGQEENAPADGGKRAVTDEDIKFALFGGNKDITDEMYEEVKRFAAYVKQRGAQE